MAEEHTKERRSRKKRHIALESRCNNYPVTQSCVDRRREERETGMKIARNEMVLLEENVTEMK